VTLHLQRFHSSRSHVQFGFLVGPSSMLTQMLKAHQTRQETLRADAGKLVPAYDASYFGGIL
jgi:hypothetical protein